MANYRALDIANFFIQYAHDLDDTSMDNLKLNKILYYAQGASLARTGKPLFLDSIQAWEFGPVVPEVYHTYKACGRYPIPEAADSFDEMRLSTDELELLIDVYECYGKYTGLTLKDMTHEPGSPWSQKFVEGVRNIEIPKDLIKTYFEANENIPEFRIKPEHLKNAAVL